MKSALTSHRFYEIDLLRFLAAISVMSFHYGFRGYAADGKTVMPYLSVVPLAKYGYLGVNLFFMISGFVILMTASCGSARKFVVSRIVRLYPAFWACCTITFLVTMIAGGVRYSASFRQYAVNMTMLSGFLGVKSIDGAYWSLFVEMKFYALVLIVLLLKLISAAKNLLGIWLGFVLLLAKIHIPYIGFFLIPDYAPYFIAGAMFYIVYAEGTSFYKIGVITICYIAAVRGVVFNAVHMRQHYNSHYSDVTLAVILAVFFIVFFFISTGRTSKYASPKWLTIGALTYPLYLIHQNVGFMIFNVFYSHVNPHLIMFGTICLVLSVAYVVNICIERPYAKPIKTWLEKLLRIEARSRTSASIS